MKEAPQGRLSGNLQADELGVNAFAENDLQEVLGMDLLWVELDDHQVRFVVMKICAQHAIVSPDLVCQCDPLIMGRVFVDVNDDVCHIHCA